MENELKGNIFEVLNYNEMSFCSNFVQIIMYLRYAVMFLRNTCLRM